MAYERENPFSSVSPASGVETGYEDAVRHDPLNKKFIARNLKPYKTLRKFSTPKGMKGLKNKNYAQLERMAVRAVLTKNKVKRRTLSNKLDRDRYSPRLLQRARQKTRAGYDIRDRSKGQLGKSTGMIQNKQVRKATKHLITIRRNRQINKTGLYQGLGYDIMKGYRKTGYRR